MPGSKRRNPAASLISLGLMVVSPASLAEETDEAPLSAAFLEFLAESDDEQGEWQDPMEYEGQQWQVLDQKTEKTEKADE